MFHQRIQFEDVELAHYYKVRAPLLIGTVGNIDSGIPILLLTLTMRLNLRQNALHTIQHAVEHLYWSERSESGDRSFDHEDHSVDWLDKHGHLCFYSPDFTRPPAEYNLKFALLHLIQGSELLLKSYIEQCEPQALFVRPGSQKTIGLREALNITIERNRKLFAPDEVKLLLEAKDLRNAIEHYQFDFSEDTLRSLCIDFLALTILLAQQLLSISLVEALSYDHLHDRPDPAVHYLSMVLQGASPTGRIATKKAGELWAAENPILRPFLCLSCGAHAVSADSGRCMGCGAEGDADVAALIQDFEAAVRKLA